jgi:hypothetical protein
MKEKSKKIILVWLMIIVITILVPIDLIFIKSTQPAGSSLLSYVLPIIIFSLVFSIYSIIIIWKRDGEKIEKDERTEALRRHAVDYSYSFTYVVVLALWFLTTFNIIRLSNSSIILIIIMVMTLSLLIARSLIHKKSIPE